MSLFLFLLEGAKLSSTWLLYWCSCIKMWGECARLILWVQKHGFQFFKKKFQPIRADGAHILLSLAERSTFPVTLLWLAEKFDKCYMLNDGKIFFRCLEIQAYGFRNIKCLMKANNALIGWKGWHKPSHPPSPVFVNWDIFWLIRRSSRDFTYCKVSAEYVYLHLNIPFEKKNWLDSLLQEVCMGA